MTVMQQHPRYEVLGLIGNGDFAAVYAARDRELGRDVAIKQIHGQYMNDARRLERFWREAQLLATLSHPHIMTIYDIVRPRGWLVLELMQGTMLDASRGQPIDLSLLRAALVGSLQALSMLHASQVIHGDIKAVESDARSPGPHQAGRFRPGPPRGERPGELPQGGRHAIWPRS